MKKVKSQRVQLSCHHQNTLIGKALVWRTGGDEGNGGDLRLGLRHHRLLRNCYCNINRTAKEQVHWSLD